MKWNSFKKSTIDNRILRVEVLPKKVSVNIEPWHHSEVLGQMELVAFGIHNIVPHNGGRSPGMWAFAPR